MSPSLLLCLALHPPWPQSDRDRETERERRERAPSWDRALNEHNQVFTCCFREGCQDASKHDVGRLGGIHRRMDPLLAVVGHQGRGLRVIGLQAGFQGCFVIIRTADQGLSSDLGEARGQSPASCSLARSPLLSAAMTTPAPLLQDRLQCGAADVIPRSAGESGANPGQPKQVPEQSLKREGFSIVVFPPHTALLAKRSPRSLKEQTSATVAPQERNQSQPTATSAMDRVQQVLRLAEPGPALQNGHALHSSLQASLPAVLSAQAAQAVPHAPQKARTEGTREGKK